MLVVALLIGMGFGWHTAQRLEFVPLHRWRGTRFALVASSTSLACMAGLIGNQIRSEFGWSALVYPQIYARTGLASLAGVWIGLLVSHWLEEDKSNRLKYQLSLRQLWLLIAIAGPAGWLLWNWPEVFAMIAIQQTTFAILLYSRSAPIHSNI
jgi:hypothetical protein